MLHINDAKRSLKVDVAISTEMQAAIDQWAMMFIDRAPWLDVDYFLETAEKFTENDCEFEWTEDFFSATLRNESGDKLPISGMDTDLRRLIVGMEIVDVRRVSA